MTSNEQGDPRILSSLKSAGGQGVVVTQDRFPAAVEAVWKAMTDRGQLARWLGDFQGELVIGTTYHSRFHASAAEGDNPDRDLRTAHPLPGRRAGRVGQRRGAGDRCHAEGGR